MSKIIILLLSILVASPALAFTPADGSANADVVAFLNYLEYIRDKSGSVGKMFVGQFVQSTDTASDWNNTDGGRYNVYVEDLAAETGKYVAAIGGAWLHDYTDTNARFEIFWDEGGLFAYVVWRPHNPFDTDCADLYGAGSSDDGCSTADCGGQGSYSCRGSGWADLNNLLAAPCVVAACTKWQAEKVRIGDAIQVLENAGVNVIFYPFNECNGQWFWWADWTNSYTAAMLRAVWIDLFNYLTTTRGLHNIVWAYGPVAYWGWQSGTNHRESWWQWYPGDAYVDIIAPSFYDDMLALNIAEYERLVQKYGANWSKTLLYTNVYEIATGKVGYAGRTGLPYTQVASIADVDTTPNSWYWAWDRSHGGKLYVYGDQTGVDFYVKYYRGGASMLTEMLDMGKLVMLGATGKNVTTYDLYNTWLAKIKADSRYLSVPIAVFWSGLWHIRGATNESLMLNNSYILTRTDVKPIAPTLSLPADEAVDVSTSPTFTTTTTYYGPRAHYITQWQCDETAGLDWTTAPYNVTSMTDLYSNNSFASGLTNNTNYSWRSRFGISVTGVTGQVVWGDWSSVRTFTTIVAGDPGGPTGGNWSGSITGSF